MREQTEIKITAGGPLSGARRAAVEAALRGATRLEIAWLSGYLAAQAGATEVGEGAADAAASVAAAGSVPLTVLYGSESGNAEGLAGQVAAAARTAGFVVKVADMGDYRQAELGKEKNVLVLVSTWGEGEPPERAKAFHSYVMGEGAPRLDGVNYAVFALGDTSYADFCECGKQFDARFEALGARRVSARVDADVDFEGPFNTWLAEVMPQMKAAAGVVAAAPPTVVVSAPEGAPSANGAVSAEPYGKKNPFPAAVKELINLNGRGSAKATYHVEFDLEGSGFSYKPGDVLGVIPQNCPQVVDDFLRSAGMDGAQVIEEGDSYITLRSLLTERYDITGLSLNVMKKYAEIAGNAALAQALLPEHKEAVKDWIDGRELRDLFREYPPSAPLSVGQLTGLLRKMPPRLYSIASSLRAHPGEVHLTVAAVKYESHGHARKGVCSTYLGERLAIGDSAKVYVHPNKHFALPDDPAAPLIMVGPGTGIAPFRAFMEEREALAAPGRNWLFFGDQHFHCDFLYQTEWQRYLKAGLLTRMDVAFSRDTAHKIYVQHRMLEKAADLWAWLQEGAYFYVCGDANRMAKDVHAALIQIAEQQGKLTPEAAVEWVDALKKAKRYQRDVY